MKKLFLDLLNHRGWLTFSFQPRSRYTAPDLSKCYAFMVGSNWQDENSSWKMKKMILLLAFKLGCKPKYLLKFSMSKHEFVDGIGFQLKKLITCSPHQSLQIFEFQFSKSLFLFIERGQENIFYWSKKFEPCKAQYSTPNFFDRLFLIRAFAF